MQISLGMELLLSVDYTVLVGWLQTLWNVNTNISNSGPDNPDLLKCFWVQFSEKTIENGVRTSDVYSPLQEVLRGS